MKRKPRDGGLARNQRRQALGAIVAASSLLIIAVLDLLPHFVRFGKWNNLVYAALMVGASFAGVMFAKAPGWRPLRWLKLAGCYIAFLGVAAGFDWARQQGNAVRSMAFFVWAALFLVFAVRELGREHRSHQQRELSDRGGHALN